MLASLMRNGLAHAQAPPHSCEEFRICEARVVRCRNHCAPGTCTCSSGGIQPDFGSVVAGAAEALGSLAGGCLCQGSLHAWDSLEVRGQWNSRLLEVLGIMVISCRGCLEDATITHVVLGCSRMGYIDRTEDGLPALGG